VPLATRRSFLRRQLKSHKNNEADFILCDFALCKLQKSYAI